MPEIPRVATNVPMTRLRRDSQSARWKDIGRERGTDARKLCDAGRRVAAIYMMGYVVEMYAKALVSETIGTVPKGQGGHDLIMLIEQAGIKRSDLPPDMRKFADERDVALRYETALPSGVDFDSTYQSACALVAYLSKRLRRL